MTQTTWTGGERHGARPEVCQQIEKDSLVQSLLQLLLKLLISQIYFQSVASSSSRRYQQSKISNRFAEEENFFPLFLGNARQLA